MILEQLDKNINRINSIANIVFFLSMVVIVIDLGFSLTFEWAIPIDTFYNFTLFTGVIIVFLKYYFNKSKADNQFRRFIRVFYLVTLLIIAMNNIWHILFGSIFDTHNLWTMLALVSLFFRSLFYQHFGINIKRFNPGQLFVLSFIFVISSGTLLLLLPDATHGNISIVNSLFTATSAVCVTGLNVVDTEYSFTLFGKTVILILIQIGGLGVMTFTTYFSYFFKGNSSFQNQFIGQDITGINRLSSVYTTLKSIFIITFSIELTGAFFIYISVLDNPLGSIGDKVFYSIFHSVSAFCNAGFSTLSGNLYDTRVRFDYSLNLVICFLIIFGGLGFPIVQNIWNYVRLSIIRLFKRVVKKNRTDSIPWIISINTKLVLTGTAILLLAGMISFWLFEKDNVLLENQSFVGKMVTAFMGSVTTRTAGFNSFDMAALSIPTILIMMFLMWIGASPASTGGGIKTTTFSVALMNVVALCKGANRVEFSGREISQYSINRAFSQIILSIIVITIATVLLMIKEIEFSGIDIFFEVVSALGTVGLSRGITFSLSDFSKIVLIFLMFVGRVGIFTVLVSLTKQVKYSNYRYPSEEILIN